MLDCILRTVSKQSLISLGRSALFYEKPVKVVADKLLSIHRGFIASIRPQWKVRMNIDMVFHEISNLLVFEDLQGFFHSW